MKENFLFLDIDGVLRTWPTPVPSYTNAAGRRVLSYHPQAVQALNWLCERSGACLVITSTWRALGLRGMQHVFNDWGVRVPIYSLLARDIPSSRPGWDGQAHDRGQQITHWLSQHTARRGAWGAGVILDDEPTTAPGCFLVQTSLATGLTVALAEIALWWLLGGTHC